MGSDMNNKCIKCGAPALESINLCQLCFRRENRNQSYLNKDSQKLSWEADIPLLTNPLVLKQLIIIVFGSGLFMALILSFIFLLTGDYDDIPFMLFVSLIVATGMGAGLFLIALLVFGNRIKVRFTIDNEKAFSETVEKRSLVGTRLTLIAGLIGGNLQAAGTGVLAASREKEYILWKDLQNAEFIPKHLMIVLNNSWRPVMLMICRPDNYELITEFVSRHVAPVARHEKVPSKPLGKWFIRTIAVFAAVAPLFALSASYFLDFDIFLPLVLFFFALATVWLIPLFGWVVIAVAIILALQLLFIGLDYFGAMYPGEQLLYLLSLAGLGFMIWFSRQSLRGKFTPLLFED